MNKYKNLSGESPIIEYEILDYSIIVKFENKKGDIACYEYTVNKIGGKFFEQVCVCAKEGQGLSTFISKNRDIYNSSVKL